MSDKNVWQPIETAPKGLPGFLALGDDGGSIEWLVDHGWDGKFYNHNSANMTAKKHWSHWIPLPEPPTDAG